MAWSRVSATTRSTRARSSARLPGQLCAASSASAAWVNVRGGFPSAAGAIVQQPRRQHRYVFQPVAQRRQIYPRRRQPAVEVRAESMLTDIVVDRRPRARDEADLGGHHLAIDAHFAIARDARQPRLDGRWQLRHILQEQRASAARPPCGCRSTPIPDRSARGSARFRTGRGRSERRCRRRSRWRSTVRPRAGCVRAARAQSTGRRFPARRPATRRCRAAQFGAPAPGRGRWRPTLQAAQLSMSRAQVERVGHWPV